MLLNANREHREQLAREERSNERHQRLLGILNNLEKGFPPLVTVAHHDLHSHTKYAATVSHQVWAAYQGDLARVKMPFPTPAEALALPIIKEQVEMDITFMQMDKNLIKLRNEVRQAIVDWGSKVRQDLLDIWTKEPLGQAHEHRSSNLVSVGKNPSITPCPVTLPGSTVEFTKPDGTTTADIRELPEDLQLLLRADVVFKSSRKSGRRHTYPGVVPSALPGFHDYKGSDCHSLGDRWDPEIVSRDDSASAVARALLEWVGRPNATFAEMRVLGATFQCGRCQHLDPYTWEQLVSLTRTVTMSTI